jgi:hypothetical protein
MENGDDILLRQLPLLIGVAEWNMEETFITPLQLLTIMKRRVSYKGEKGARLPFLFLFYRNIF